jgi:hypothetical protein
VAQEQRPHHTFVETFATQQLLPPFTSMGVTVRVFLFRLSPDVVQAYCDRFLNLGETWKRPVHYMALPDAPLGVLAITDYPCTVSKRPPGTIDPRAGSDDWDKVSQHELYAAAPVYRYRVAAGGALVEPELQWVQPFLVNNNASAAFSSREVLGLEPLWGEFEFPLGEDPGFAVDVKLPSWRVFRWDSKQERLPFLSVRTGPVLTDQQVQATFEDIEKDPVALADIIALQKAIPDLNLTVGSAIPTAMTMVILKQFREAGDPSKAIYQALVNGQCRFSKINTPERPIHFFDPKRCILQFTPGAMVDEIIATLLHIPQGVLQARVDKLAAGEKVDPVNLEVRMAVTFQADIEFDAIETIHRF